MMPQPLKDRCPLAAALSGSSRAAFHNSPERQRSTRRPEIRLQLEPIRTVSLTTLLRQESRYGC